MHLVQVQRAPSVAPPEPANLALSDFVDEFGDSLLAAVRRQNPPIYDGKSDPYRDALMDRLARRPFPAQREAVQALTCLLFDAGEPAAVLNAEMGTGKTIMAIAAAALMHDAGYHRTLVLSPPHLVYKWRREIKTTTPDARVWILNGPDTLQKLLTLRAMRTRPTVPEFFVLGRVRMRMGFHWRPAFAVRKTVYHDEFGARHLDAYASCPDCGEWLTNKAEDGTDIPLSVPRARQVLDENRCACSRCGARLWTLMRKGKPQRTPRELVVDALQQLPTIGAKTAERLVSRFGEEMLGAMLADNLYEFINLMDEQGDLVFSDRQAARMERAMAAMEFSFGQGDYQATEFIKRYLPQGYFGFLVVDEGHEYKNAGSAQGQAMAVLASKCAKILLLTGTLMGGYADDLFYLLWRLNPRAMIDDGYRANVRGSLGPAAMAFMRDHGVVKDIYREVGAHAHRTAKGKTISHRTAKAPGFGPKGIMRYVLPCTVFLKLKDIGGNVLPAYRETFESVDMTDTQCEEYAKLAGVLRAELVQALRCGDATLLGVVLQVLLAWPDCCFRDELVRHPRTRAQLAFQRAIFGDGEVSPKELALIDLCRREKGRGRKVLVYSIYTGTRDTTMRLRAQLEQHGFKVAVLRASVDAAKREDWVADQVERGINVLITNPELVKTGLDLLDFPTIAYMQSGYNVYTLQQASRRSWRIGQTHPVDVHFFGYADTAQMACLALMAQKIAVAQSTSGDMPDTGLDVLNQSGDSIEVALAKKLIA
ncbi:SNF2-related protein [Aromatoleum bremense]|uniref:Helicase n=1 Tax=Aromatoleum bremense TaxID=76115 RepID=A0ABX1NUY9_9RHOO|nr:SNF2-related protein [Aromatoleum bremense]NMG15747.1 helicase [Aromatoleum bremense]QTQ30054.1 Helicase [Aromatoleum bremense]